MAPWSWSQEAQKEHLEVRPALKPGEGARVVKIDDMQLLAIGQYVTGMEVSVQAKYSNLPGTFETCFDAREDLL